MEGSVAIFYFNTLKVTQWPVSIRSVLEIMKLGLLPDLLNWDLWKPRTAHYLGFTKLSDNKELKFLNMLAYGKEY